jgi:hypothetical protein
MAAPRWGVLDGAGGQPGTCAPAAAISRQASQAGCQAPGLRGKESLSAVADDRWRRLGRGDAGRPAHALR